MTLITKNNRGFDEFFIENENIDVSIDIDEAKDILDGCRSIEDVYNDNVIIDYNDIEYEGDDGQIVHSLVPIRKKDLIPSPILDDELPPF